MDSELLFAIAEMIRAAARQHGMILTDVEFTVCRPHDETSAVAQKMCKRLPKTTHRCTSNLFLR